MSTSNSFSDASFPRPPVAALAGITLPTSSLLDPAISYLKKHASPIVYRHLLRSTYFALLIASRAPHLKGTDTNLVTLAALFHDLGWDPTGNLVSDDKRFEVDGANAARDFLQSNGLIDVRQIQIVWDAIALHTTPSIAFHKESEVVATVQGILTDFIGPDGSLVTKEDFHEIERAFPRAGFKDSNREILCGLCRNKAATTYDNTVGQFGEKYVEGYSLDGKRGIDMLERGYYAE